MKKTIVILGGGAAGWLTALYIEKNYPKSDITIIEDPNTPPIIAGESGSALFNKLYNFLGINFDEWVIATNALPKLGGTFTDWKEIGTDFVHGLIPDWYNARYAGEFPEFGRNNDFVACTIAANIKQENIYYNGRLQRLGKLPLTPSSEPGLKFNTLTMPMWHFDSRANAKFLKDLGLKRGIKLVEGKYQRCTRLPSGGIDSLILEDGKVINGGWYFDCSGFARLLAHKELGEPLADLTHYFPARHALAWWEDGCNMKNHTGVKAMKYGWSWEIGLNHRVGNGYVFDPDLLSVDQAQQEIEETFNKKITPVASLRFQPCQMQNIWRENVIAVGLSSGFVEPLESNGLLVVVAACSLLGEFWSPTMDHLPKTQQIFNKEFLTRMNDIRDFLALHYRTKRKDTEFWRSHAEDKDRIPDSLQYRLDLFKEGFLGPSDTMSYGFESYATVAQAMDLINVEKLKDRLLCKRSTMMEDYQKYYQLLSQEIDNISSICYTMEQWRNITYGQS
jgi:tryptophan halogenase